MTRKIAFLACALTLAPAVAHADVEVRAQADRMLVAMESYAHRVAWLLRQAREARVPGRIHCVDAYLTQVDTEVRHGRDDVADLRAALSSRDGAAARRALAWLSARRAAARAASLAADRCVPPTPAPRRQSDQTTVRVVAPSLPPDRAVFTR